jgi:hypothetical protein
MAPFLFTFGGVCYYFVIPEHCHLLIFLYYIPCNDIIISLSPTSPFVVLAGFSWSHSDGFNWMQPTIAATI